jgi:GcrA cell cycle regulator
MTGCDAPFGPWGTTAGLTERLKELHAAPQMYSNTEIARMLSREFKISLSRNAIIGKIARLGLVHRYGASKGGGSKPGRVPPRPRLRPSASPGAAGTASGEAKRSRVERPGTLSLLELRDGDCKWPDGDGPYLFCGRACVPERPYCAEHLRMAHNEPRERAA